MSDEEEPTECRVVTVEDEVVHELTAGDAAFVIRDEGGFEISLPKKVDKDGNATEAAAWVTMLGWMFSPSGQETREAAWEAFEEWSQSRRDAPTERHLKSVPEED